MEEKVIPNVSIFFFLSCCCGSLFSFLILYIMEGQTLLPDGPKILPNNSKLAPDKKKFQGRKIGGRKIKNFDKKWKRG
jgi:hypothetical protein